MDIINMATNTCSQHSINKHMGELTIRIFRKTSSPERVMFSCTFLYKMDLSHSRQWFLAINVTLRDQLFGTTISKERTL